MPATWEMEASPIKVSLTLSETTYSPGMVTYICNPSYTRGREQEDCGSRPARAKIRKFSFQQISLVWWHVPTTLEDHK
jgi:hypothetical protein